MQEPQEIPDAQHELGDMVEALIAGERNPRRLADLARGRMKAKRAALIEALTGRFEDHHGEHARVLLTQIDALNVQIDALTARIEALIAALPAAQGVDGDGTTGPSAGQGPDSAVLPAMDRLGEVPGISRHAAQVHPHPPARSPRLRCHHRPRPPEPGAPRVP